ncbi:MAG: PAS domain S-box protein [Prolixibacteraceae bacterium]|jgi:PAS domain S-box-containing protein|nr:PAS domain S-box protein [Prolixibacteraceae bacterium]
MTDQNKTKEELINELQELRQKYDSLKISTETDIRERKTTEEELRYVNNQKLAENALQENEARYRGLLQNLEAGIVVHAPDTSIIMNNSRAAELLGLTGEQMKGKAAIDPAWKFINEDNTQLPPDGYPVNRILASKEPIKNQILGICHPVKNDIAWVTVNGFPVLNKKAEITEIVNSFIDISERKVAEEALLEANWKFRALFEKGPIGVAYHAMVNDDLGEPKDYFFLDANEAYRELTGVDPRGKLVTEAFPGIENDPFNWIGTFGKVAQTGETIHFEQYLQPNQRWYDCVGYQYKPEHFVAAFFEITQRKVAEEALRSSEENLSITLHSIGDGVISTDIKGMVVNMNPIAEKLCGWNLADAIGKPLSDVFKIINSDSREKVENPAEIVIETGKIVGLANHTVLVSKNRSEYQIADSAAPIKNKDGLISGVVLVFSDVTEKYAAQKQIKESEERFNLAMKASNDGLFDWNLETNDIYYSPGWKKMLGYEDHEIPNDFAIWETTTDPDDIKKSWELQQKLISKQIDRFVIEFKMKHKKGHWVDILSRAEAFFNDAGKAIRMVGTHVDISERKKSEKELINAKEKAEKNELELKKAQAITHIGSWYLDVVTNQVTWSEELYKMYGFDSKKPVPPYTEHMKLFTPESWDILSKSLENTREKDIPYELELTTVRKDGSNGCMWVRGETVKDSNGKIIALWGAAQDISERKQIEHQLRLAKEKAEESDRLKSAFLANMSHEIRTPMNSIMGFASLLPEEESKELMCRYASVIVQNSEQLVSLIDNIVMYSKLQSGLFVYKPAKLNVSELLNDIQQSFNLPIYQQGVSLKIECNSCEATQVYSDYDKLRQIITNLTVNAYKYTSHGEIVLGFNQRDDGFEYYVKDTGIGIPIKDLGHVFERFYRGSNIDESKMRGTGLGLCIVKDLVEMLGGKIWVESEIGKGSTFYFTIPTKG